MSNGDIQTIQLAPDNANDANDANDANEEADDETSQQEVMKEGFTFAEF